MGKGWTNSIPLGLILLGGGGMYFTSYLPKSQIPEEVLARVVQTGLPNQKKDMGDHQADFGLG